MRDFGARIQDEDVQGVEIMRPNVIISQPELQLEEWGKGGGYFFNIIILDIKVTSKNYFQRVYGFSNLPQIIYVCNTYVDIDSESVGPLLKISRSKSTTT